MSTISKQYQNTNNGGQERVMRAGNQYYINSYIPSVGWMGDRKVSLDQVKSCMAYTNAPADVMTAILA